MRLADLWRSSLVQIAAAYTLLILSSLVILLLLLLVFVNHDIREQTRESVEQDVRQLTKIYAQRGRDELLANLRILSTSIESDRSLYVLEDAAGRVIVGTDKEIEPFKGWMEITLPRLSKAPDQFLVFAAPLNDMTLFVGRRTHTEKEARRSVLRSFALAMCLVVPVSLAAGFYLARQSLQRVDKIAEVMRTFVAGQLTQRAPRTNRGDEIDRLAANINSTLHQVERLVTNLKQISTDIAHDLKTPLGRLRQRLERASLSDACDTGLLKDAIDEIDGILLTFDSLMQIAEVDAGVARLRFKDINLSELAGSVCDIYGSVAEDNGHALRLEVAGQAVIRGDRNLLTQLLANLIENGIRHTPNGSSIAISVQREEDRARITVADNGPGIPEDERQSVFQRFYRLEDSRTTPGSGLGLTLVKAICELHDAEIELGENHPGLLVRIAFPLPR